MNRMYSLVWIGFAAVLADPQHLSAAQGTIPSTGTVPLVLSAERGPSALGVDVGALVAKLCGRTPRPFGGAEDCRLVAGDQHFPEDPNHNLHLDLKEVRLGSNGLLEAGFEPTELFLRGEPLATPCGVWQWTLTLDPARRPTVSTVELLPLADEPGAGSTRGLLHLDGLLTLTHEATGKTARLPFPMDLDLLARYAIADEGGYGLANSDLELFADPAGVERSGCISQRTKCGRLCLAPVARKGSAFPLGPR